MNKATLTHLMTQLLWIVLLTSLPIIVVACVVGVTG